MLLIRPDHLGDVLLASPSVEALRRALPEAHLAMMVGPWSAEVAQRDPLLDELLLCPFPGFTRTSKGSPLAPYRLLWETAAELRRRRYDAVLVLRYDHWWGAFLAALAGIPVRVGCAVPECAPFLSHSIELAERVHWVEQGLRAVGRLLEVWQIDSGQAAVRPPLRFPVVVDEEREAERLWAELESADRRPAVALHPGTGSALKLWPEGRWAELGRALVGKGLQVVVTGSPAEAEVAGRIAGSIPGGVSLAGRTGFGVLAALFRECRLVVGVDSGPLHLAVAAGTPSVHLFGPTDPAVYGPWGDAARHRIVVADFVCPCGRLDLRPPEASAAACMEGITVARAMEECEEVLSAGR